MKYYLVLFSIIFLPCKVFGEENILDPVLVTGSSFPVEISEFSSDVSVIDREFIESSKARNISELLRTVPGVFVDSQGGRGGISSVYIRGGDPNFTLVLLDGIKLNDPNNSRGGSFDLSTLGTDNIERIEVVKGPQSSVYGSDAISGVINIITRSGESERKSGVDVFAQTDAGFRVLAETRGVNGGLSHSLTASYTDNGDPTPGNQFKSPTFISNIGYSTENLEIKSVSRFSHIESEAFPDDSGGPEFAVIRETEDRKFDQFVTGLKFIHLPGDRWANNINLYLTHLDEDTDSPGVAPGERDPFGIPPNTTDSEYTRFEAQYVTVFNFASHNLLSFGIDTQYERGRSSGALNAGEEKIQTSFKESRFTVSPLTEIKLKTLKNLYIYAGARLDFPEGFGTEFSPHLGVLYKFSKVGTTLSANWGEGFKLPSFFALGNPIVGNQDLRPETSDSYDFTLSQKMFNNSLIFSTTAFYNKFRNLIDFEEGPPPRLVNRDEVVSKGVELEMKTAKFFNMMVSGNLSYIDSDIIGSTENLRNRPEWLANFNLIWTPESFLEFFTNINYVGSFFDSSIPTGEVKIGDYVVVDFVVTVFVNKKIEIYLEIENVFDQQYQQAVGFNAPGIRPGGGIRWSF